jgi:hypothetical protein
MPALLPKLHWKGSDGRFEPRRVRFGNQLRLWGCPVRRIPHLRRVLRENVWLRSSTATDLRPAPLRDLTGRRLAVVAGKAKPTATLRVTA